MMFGNLRGSINPIPGVIIGGISGLTMWSGGTTYCNIFMEDCFYNEIVERGFIKEIEDRVFKKEQDLN